MGKATLVVAVAGLFVSAATLTIVVAVGLKAQESRDAILSSPGGKILARFFPSWFAGDEA